MASRLRRKAQGWGARIRFGEKLGRDEWIALDVPHDQEPLAAERLARLQAMAKRLSELGKHVEARLILEEAAASRHERGFRAIESMVEEMVEETAPGALARPAPLTFRQVVQRLCDGELHERYPEKVNERTQEGNDTRRARLAHFFPVLGNKTFDEITLEDIEDAKLLIPRERSRQHPKGVGRNTRVIYCRDLRFVVNTLAVKVLRLTESTPLVEVPRQESKRKARLKQVIYPEEEAMIAGATIAVSFEERFLYAWLARNMTRISETLQYVWDAFSLERGIIRVRAEWTKTGVSRTWLLEPDVLEAMRLRYADLVRANGGRPIPGDTLVFQPPPLRVLTRGTVHQHLHAHAKAAGVSRRELFDPPAGERQLTTHDFRGSGITLCRAVGVPDRWTMDRTGHETIKEFEGYDRGTRQVREQALEWWAPMAVALRMPGAKVFATGAELAKRLGPKWPRVWAKVYETPEKMPLRTNRCESPHNGSQPFSSTISEVEQPSIRPNDPLGPAHISISGQSGQRTETAPHEPLGLPVGGYTTALSEATLRRLLDLASRAGEWDAVGELSAQLKAAEAARETNVASLDAARRRRDGGRS